MKKAALAVFSLFLSAFYGQVQSLNPVQMDAILSDFTEIASLEPVYENSAAERGLLRFIVQRLSNLGISYKTSAFEDLSDEHSFSRSVEVDIRGNTEDTLIFAVPIDSEPAPGEKVFKTSAPGLSLMLELIRKYSVERPLINMKFLFLGSEFREEGNKNLGSQNFLRFYTPPAGAVVLYLRVLDFNTPLELKASSNKKGSPLWLIERIRKTDAQTNFGFDINTAENLIYRFGFQTQSLPITNFLEYSIPAVELLSADDSKKNLSTSTWISTFYLFVDEFQDNILDGIPPRWDQHYFIFPSPFGYIVLGESVYMAVLCAIYLLAVFYMTFFTPRVKHYFRSLRRSLWSLPVIMAVFFLCFLASTGILDLIISLTGIPLRWTSHPLAYFLLKIIFCSLLFYPFFHVMDRKPFSRNGSFYSALAIIFLSLDILVLSFINISYAIFPAWALLFAFCFSVAKKTIPKFFFLMASPFLLIIAILGIFQIPALDLCKLVIFDPFLGNLFLSAILLPFGLLLYRLRLLVRRYYVSGVPLLMYTSYFSFWIIGLVMLLLIQLSASFGPGHPQPVEISEYIDMSTHSSILTLESPAQLPEFTLSQNPRTIFNPVEGGRKQTFILENTQYILEPEITNETFFGRTNYEFRLSGNAGIEEITISLTAEEPILLYDCSFPYIQESLNHSARIIIGNNPAFPFIVNFSVPKDLKFILHYQLKYLTAANVPVRPMENVDLSYRRIVSGSITSDGNSL